MLAAGFAWAQTKAQTQNPPQKKGVEQKQAETDQDYTEEEYNAMEAARNEQDPVKQCNLVMQFLEKYPKSTLKAYVVNLYETALYNVAKAGDYKNLGPLAEQWLKLNPNDLKCQAYIFDAAAALGQHQKVVEYGEKIYAQAPSAKIALPIYQAYEKLGNKAKKEEWALKLLQYPEYSNDIQLRMEFVVEYADKDLNKAAGYAEQVIKAAPGAPKPASMSDGDWSKALTSVKKTCFDIVGMNYFKQNKWNEAIQNLQKALEQEEYDGAYYYIAQSQWRLNDVDNAIDSFLIAYVMKGKFESQAKDNAEKLYKSQHNDTLVNFDRAVKKAQAIVDARKIKK
jgi:tetratricopeptide (TPR) repeat protein